MQDITLGMFVLHHAFEPVVFTVWWNALEPAVASHQLASLSLAVGMAFYGLGMALGMLRQRLWPSWPEGGSFGNSVAESGRPRGSVAPLASRASASAPDAEPETSVAGLGLGSVAPGEFQAGAHLQHGLRPASGQSLGHRPGSAAKALTEKSVESEPDLGPATAGSRLWEPPVRSVDREFLDRAVRVIENHLDDPDLTVEQLAVEMVCDRSHLFRRLRALTGQSPSSLIRYLRLERAKELLRADFGTVTEVAFSLGFKSVSHFSNSFTKTYGERPSAFASRHRIRRPVEHHGPRQKAGVR